jgi:drug/metabolite transporter (DMT)-like permease
VRSGRLWRDRAGARDTIDGVTSRLTPSTAALLVLPPLFWAGNAVVGRALVGHFPPLALSFWRWALAFAILAPFAVGSIRAHRDTIR